MCFGANKLPGVWITFKSCFNTLNQFGEQNAFQGASFNGVFRCIYPKQTLCFRPGGNTHLPLRLTIARCWCQKILPRLSTHTHPPPPAPLWVWRHLQHRAKSEPGVWVFLHWVAGCFNSLEVCTTKPSVWGSRPQGRWSCGLWLSSQARSKWKISQE